MKTSLICGLALVVSGFSAPAMAQSSAETLVAACKAETHARGSFAIVDTGIIPQVAGASGATQRGVRNVNDCLKDKYQTQPGLIAASAPNGVVTAQGKCAELRNRSGGEAFARGAAASIGLGAIGAGWHATALTRNFQDCLGAVPIGVQATNQPFQTLSCRRSASVLQGGTGYCRRR